MNKLKNTLLCLGMLGLSLTSLQATSTPVMDSPATEEVRQPKKVEHTVYELESLFVLMQERLSLMHDVAKFKWKTSTQSTPLDGEFLELDQLGQENDAFIASFFDAQNQAAQETVLKDYALFEKEQLEKFESAKDYQTEILPQLRSIDAQMLVTLNQLLVHTQNESLPEFLKELSFSSFQNEGIDRSIYDIAVDPLFQD